MDINQRLHSSWQQLSQYLPDTKHRNESIYVRKIGISSHFGRISMKRDNCKCDHLGLLRDFNSIEVSCTLVTCVIYEFTLPEKAKYEYEHIYSSAAYAILYLLYQLVSAFSV